MVRKIVLELLCRFNDLFVALSTDDYAKADQIHIKLMVDHISEVTKVTLHKWNYDLFALIIYIQHIQLH